MNKSYARSSNRCRRAISRIKMMMMTIHFPMPWILKNWIFVTTFYFKFNFLSDGNNKCSFVIDWVHATEYFAEKLSHRIFNLRPHKSVFFFWFENVSVWSFVTCWIIHFRFFALRSAFYRAKSCNFHLQFKGRKRRLSLFSCDTGSFCFK